MGSCMSTLVSSTNSLRGPFLRLARVAAFGRSADFGTAVVGEGFVAMTVFCPALGAAADGLRERALRWLSDAISVAKTRAVLGAFLGALVSI